MITSVASGIMAATLMVMSLFMGCWPAVLKGSPHAGQPLVWWFGLEATAQAGQLVPAAHPLPEQEIPPIPTFSRLFSRSLFVSHSLSLFPYLYFSHNLVVNTVIHIFFKRIAVSCLILPTGLPWTLCHLSLAL